MSDPRARVRSLLTVPSRALARAGGATGLARGAARRARRVRRWVFASRRRAVGVVLAVLAAPWLLLFLMAAVTPLPEGLTEPTAPSVRVLSREGRLLREVRADDGARARWLPISEVPPHVRDAVLAAEDRRFYSHFGVDPVAVLRATVSNARHRRVVSGASTLTMQLARAVRPHRRSLWGKLTEGALAVRIEASLSKEQILEAYMNRVVYGPNLRGYAAASHSIFGRPPDALSVSEAALVAGLPRGPSYYDVHKRPERARTRRDRVLSRMLAFEMIDRAAYDEAIAEPLVKSQDRPAFGAPHLVRGLLDGTVAAAQPDLRDALRAGKGTVSEIQTTIDLDLQRSAEGAVRTTLPGLAAHHVTAASVVVLDNERGDVLAYVGSHDFFDEAGGGQNDGVRALRQPGSALKPFVYAEAMTRLGYTAATMLPDVELHVPLPGGGDYSPHDYDGKLRGPVKLREALGNSLNIPAVYTITRVGTAPVLERLRALGFASLTEDAEHYGPALALGGGEVTLLELASAYATLARGGVTRAPRVVTELRGGGAARSFPAAPGTRVLDERVSAVLTDVLADKGARVASFGDQSVLELGFDVAAKTGTSKGFRDNVAVGYTREVTVAVWVGNFDGSPMRDVSGIVGAGPIFREVMTAAAASAARRGGRAAPLTLDREGARLGLRRTSVCALTGEIASHACPHRVHEWLPEGDADHAPTCEVHQRARVDARNGLLAGPACGPETTESRLFERWDAPYSAWAARVGRPLLPTASSPACPVPEGPAAAAGRLRITYPVDGARFVVDPDRPRELQVVDVLVAGASGPVALLVDGVPEKSAAFRLEPGDHVLEARAAGAVSPPVRVVVR